MRVEDARLAEDGFELIQGLLDEEQIAELREELEQQDFSGTPNRRGEFEQFPKVARLASGRLIKDALRGVAGRECFAVRAILFDKTEDANWHVRWHQDRAIAVRKRYDVTGFSGWSVKEGVAHALAPVEVLETMVSIRLHLDDTPAENAALKVAPGSHRSGLVSGEDRAALREENSEVICEAKAGDALLMRPLLLHSSSVAEQPRHRRVVHLECATEDLPEGLEWHWRL